MNKTVIILLVLTVILSSCYNGDEMGDNVIPKKCLDETNIVISTNFCADRSFLECEMRLLGHKALSNTIKQRFTDFCLERGAIILFENNSGNTIESTVYTNTYNNNQYSVLGNYTSDTCKHFCLDSELARLGIRSSAFTLSLALRTGISRPPKEGDPIGTGIHSSLSIFAHHLNTSRYIFELPLEDYDDQPIVPDTFYIRLHDQIDLNGTTFSGIYSNENNISNTTWLVGKERVYFHPNDGLIAVRDSLGVLWSRI